MFNSTCSPLIEEKMSEYQEEISSNDLLSPMVETELTRAIKIEQKLLDHNEIISKLKNKNDHYIKVIGL